MIGCFRPWGELRWVLEKIPVVDWSLLGAISPEDRCLSTWLAAKGVGRVHAESLLRIVDKESRFVEQTESQAKALIGEYVRNGGDLHAVKDCPLFASHNDLVAIVDGFVRDFGPNVILDISSLPKRFFFPFVKRLMRRDSGAQNVIVTYAIPEEYTPEALSEAYQGWRALPLFTPIPEPHAYEVFIVGVGFQSMGLPEQVKIHRGDMEIEILFPFPPGPPGMKRSWEFVLDLERDLPDSRPTEIRYVSSRDSSLAFEHLLAITSNGERPAILAPYGPKPHALAMSLFAMQAQAKVCYTQPSIYHPEYSIGRSMRNGLPEVCAYCLRLGGRDFYTIP